MTADDYLDLVTSEHAGQPDFAAVVRALTGPAAEQQAALASLVPAFDLDTAVGAQLDAVGLWVGLSRALSVALGDVYFSWDRTADVGWDRGNWKGDFDPDTGLTSLPDSDYRVALKARIAANQWDGTMEGASRIWGRVFAGTRDIVVQDGQDMTMSVSFVGSVLSAVQVALLTGGYFPLKPWGVRIKFYGMPVNAGPLFAWDADTPSLKGWGAGSWVQEIQPR